MGDFEIRQGDALELLRQMPAASVDAVVTDPPYSVTGDAAIAASRSIRQPAETQFFKAWLVEHVTEWIRVTNPKGAWWLSLDFRGCMVLDEVIARLGVRRAPTIGIWDKKRIGMGGILRRRYESFAVVPLNEFEVQTTGDPDVWEIPWGGGKSGVTDHPAEKPLALMERAIRLVLPRGGVVLDPFCGSGTTAVAAARLGCGFIGLERDPDFVSMARRRIAGPLFAEGGA